MTRLERDSAPIIPWLSHENMTRSTVIKSAESFLFSWGEFGVNYRKTPNNTARHHVMIYVVNKVKTTTF
jgi:hypothetical protein